MNKILFFFPYFDKFFMTEQRDLNRPIAYHGMLAVTGDFCSASKKEHTLQNLNCSILSSEDAAFLFSFLFAFFVNLACMIASQL